MGIGTPEGDLWASVLHLAMIEGFYGCPGTQYSTLADNSQAVSFLTAERGEWAASRKLICDAVGIEDDVFTAMCRDVLEGGPLPDVPGFDPRREIDLARQRELYRALKETSTPAVRPAVRSVKPEPVAVLAPPAPVEPEDDMEEAIFAVMTQPRTSTPVEVTVDGLLYWPVKAPDTGTFQRKPLPAVGTKQYRVMRVAARLRGGNLTGFYQCGDDWEDTLRDVAARYDLELVMLKDARPAAEMTGETRLYLRLRP